jgi:hypothetical protein
MSPRTFQNQAGSSAPPAPSSVLVDPLKPSISQSNSTECLDVLKFPDIPFTAGDISPSSTSSEMLETMQELGNYYSSGLGIQPLQVRFAGSEMSDFLHGMPVQLITSLNPANALPVPSHTSLVSSTSLEQPLTHSDPEQEPTDVPPSDASTHISRSLEIGDTPTEPSSTSSELSNQTDLSPRLLDVIKSNIMSLLDAQSGPPSLTSTYGSSDEATWKFPPAAGMAGMTNPEGMAHRRLERITIEDLVLSAFNRDDNTGIPNPDLCTICSRLGLTAQSFLPRGPYNTRIPREWDEKLFDRPFQEIQMENICPLCQLIRSAIGTACSTDAIDPGGLHCTLSMTMFSCYWDNQNFYESFRFLAVTLKNPGSGESIISVDLLPVESKRYPLGFIGRTVDSDQVSPTLIRRWLHQCEQVHGSKCASMEFQHYPARNPSPAHPFTRFVGLLPSLYFIDVHKNCLTTLPSPDRYIALSYVWGDCRTLRTTKDTLDGLMKSGSILAAQGRLPAVINDAIRLTMDLGERYLWVDSLCIVQDDYDTKQNTINKMNLLYENALLTIIAATGDNADAGLPGVRPHTRILKQESAIIAEDLKMIVPHYLKTLEHSAWASRAWT